MDAGNGAWTPVYDSFRFDHQTIPLDSEGFRRLLEGDGGAAAGRDGAAAEGPPAKKGE